MTGVLAVEDKQAILMGGFWYRPGKEASMEKNRFRSAGGGGDRWVTEESEDLKPGDPGGTTPVVVVRMVKKNGAILSGVFKLQSAQTDGQGASGLYHYEETLLSPSSAFLEAAHFQYSYATPEYDQRVRLLWFDSAESAAAGTGTGRSGVGVVAVVPGKIPLGLEQKILDENKKMVGVPTGTEIEGFRKAYDGSSPMALWYCIVLYANFKVRTENGIASFSNVLLGKNAIIEWLGQCPKLSRTGKMDCYTILQACAAPIACKFVNYKSEKRNQMHNGIETYAACNGRAGYGDCEDMALAYYTFIVSLKTHLREWDDFEYKGLQELPWAKMKPGIVAGYYNNGEPEAHMWACVLNLSTTDGKLGDGAVLAPEMVHFIETVTGNKKYDYDASRYTAVRLFTEDGAYWVRTNHAGAGGGAQSEMASSLGFNPGKCGVSRAEFVKSNSGRGLAPLGYSTAKNKGDVADEQLLHLASTRIVIDSLFFQPPAATGSESRSRQRAPRSGRDFVAHPQRLGGAMHG